MDQPSPSEMSVLKALWTQSPLGAREIHERAGSSRDWSYSTTRTLIARMVDKGLIERGDAHGLAVFHPRATKAQVLSMMVRSFSAQVFDLDEPLPASAFASSPLLDPDDVAELEKLLAEPAGETS
ncbi:BlaI/MecI/CopY family transcriptional regulator [Hyphobacterium marinum]|uniref:BlaI/MecI/CopY family transcriptional regulator n=1 Tax=Hyphobacterium marinum TaxID=3116574 RepID=A0ABU7LXB8_9PROT|nr:BlaI/MecI/CopY family transcriptional regulator [Hyphobacterium sp. Y6023]MEE2566116.1 BlaI/MecI/CopY family transcriptional regulator [Hyphobacterium sp. Y6023]